MTLATAAFDALALEFEREFFALDPVAASFVDGRRDGELPPVGSDALARERASNARITSALARTPVPDDAGARLDARHMAARAAHASLSLDERPRFENPGWYTGELAFGLISLFLPSALERAPDALAQRIEAAPAFLSAGIAALRERAVPGDWCERARLEAGAIARLLDAIESGAVPLGGLRAPQARAMAATRAALDAFVAMLADRPDRSPACGRAHLDALLRDVHGFADDSRALERDAATAFDEALAQMESLAARLDPTRTWREQLAALATQGPEAVDVLETYRRADARARELGDALVPVAHDYGLEYVMLPPWTRAIAGDLYFLFYRSPSPVAPGTGSTYFVAAPHGDAAEVARAHNYATIKEVHAVHHGSVGHHTQNAFARAARSRFGRFAGNDCASGIALLAAGTMVEGWATYGEDVMDEIPEFYTPAERLQVAHSRLRLAATALGDLRLHSETWTLEEMRRFYREDAAFAPGRVWSETTRNSIFPSSRVMYWAGNRAIRRLRERSTVAPREFHRALLAYGHVAVAWAGEELERSGVVR
jgi:hypothetical protein